MRFIYSIQDNDCDKYFTINDYFSKCEELDSLTETNERLQGDLSIVSKTMTVIEAKLEQVQEDFTR